MRPVDDAGRDTCAFQGGVFERSAKLLGQCGSAVFVRRFMRSDLAQRVDESGAFDTGATEDEIVRAVDAAYGGNAYGSVLFPSETLYWMGYLYRYWSLATTTPSARVYDICGAREMRDLYYAYHTVDPTQCVERILEAKGLPVDDESDAERLRRGVEALRRLRAGPA